MNQGKYVFVAVAALSLLVAACKINKDANCLNPKAGCYNKDTEAPRVTSTTPASTADTASPTPVATLNTVIITFSEPMKNADVKANYPNPVGGGSSLVINSVSKINDQRYQLNLSGLPGSGNVQFDVSLLTDLAGNTTSPGNFTIVTSSIGAVPDTVSSAGGYTESNITWTNTTPNDMNYVIKKNGTDCATASAVTGTNVSGTVATNVQVITNLGFAQFTAGSTDIIRVCLTPVSTGTATSFTVSVSRDDSAPTITAPTTGRVKIPYAIALTCTDNVDRIIYTVDGSVPSFTVTATGTNIGATASANSTVFSIASGYSLTTRGAVSFKYLCIDKAGHTNTGGVQTSSLQSKFVWDESNWAPVAPNDVWD